ncbi:MAG: hypothetical protein QXU62_01210 [Thermofilaceae archaeon]
MPGATACYECLPFDEMEAWLEEQVNRVWEENVLEYPSVQKPELIPLLKKMHQVVPSFMYLKHGSVQPCSA